MKGIKLGKLTIQPEAIQISIGGGVVSVHLTEISTQLEPFDWHYDKDKKFPKMQDDGKALVKIKGLSLDVRFKVHVEESSHDMSVRPRVFSLSANSRCASAFPPLPLPEVGACIYDAWGINRPLNKSCMTDIGLHIWCAHGRLYSHARVHVCLLMILLLLWHVCLLMILLLFLGMVLLREHVRWLSILLNHLGRAMCCGHMRCGRALRVVPIKSRRIAWGMNRPLIIMHCHFLPTYLMRAWLIILPRTRTHYRAGFTDKQNFARTK